MSAFDIFPGKIQIIIRAPIFRHFSPLAVLEKSNNSFLSVSSTGTRPASNVFFLWNATPTFCSSKKVREREERRREQKAKVYQHLHIF